MKVTVLGRVYNPFAIALCISFPIIGAIVASEIGFFWGMVAACVLQIVILVWRSVASRL